MRLLDDNKIKEILFSENYLDQATIDRAEQASKGSNVDFVEYLLSEGDFTRDLLGQAIGEHFGLPYINLRKQKLKSEYVQMIPESMARAKGVVLLDIGDETAKIGLANPEDIATKQLVGKKLGRRVTPYFILDQDLREALGMYRSSIADEFDGILKKMSDPEITREDRDEIIVKIVDTLLQYGAQYKASDIHLEPYTEYILTRFRVDGVMQDVLKIPKELSELIITRVKILSNLRTDEHRAAQDGKMKFEAYGNSIDVRVSILPVTQGENVVMRLLFSKNEQFTLGDLGLSEHDLVKVKRVIKNPHGMILVTGPTGSGKTTSLYVTLRMLDRREVTITTIEDPVEYDIETISQIQVNPKVGLTFAKGLRSIVRQDPDIVMVGEIRDQETADIAVNAALTGHLVLSTLHTNDAATTLPRLLDMGVEPFLVASTVNVAIAQRLVRKICTNCRASYQPDDKEKSAIKNNPAILKVLKGNKKLDLNKIRLYRGTGCSVCGGTGYSGRIGIFEILEMSDEIKKMIVGEASSDQIKEQAKKEGMTTMFDDGMDKVVKGVTTIEEVMRVITD